MGREDHGLPPDNFQETPEPRVAHRTSPTNIGMGLLATLAAHDLGFIDTDGARRADRRDARRRWRAWSATRATCSTGTTRGRLAPLPPRYVSTVDSGNLAGALDGARRAALRRAAGDLARPGSPRARSRLRGRRWASASSTTRSAGSSRSATAWPTPRGRGASTPPTTTCWPRRRGSRASSRSPRATLPETHWFHLGRLVTSVDGTPDAPLVERHDVRVPDAAAPDAQLSRRRCSTRPAGWPCGARSSTPRERGVPWGISESAYDLVDRHGNYQYKAFGVPGPRPEARPRRRARGRALRHGARRAGRRRRAPRANLRRLAARRASPARYGFYEAIDYTPRARPASSPTASRRRVARGTVVRAYIAHHQGMTLVALANVLLGDPMVRRFHADPRVQATELLLQERVPRDVADHAAAARRGDARRRPPPAPSPCAASARRTRAFPHAQFLSNGSYTAVVTNAGGGASFCRGRVVTRRREDADPRPGQPVPLPARRAQRRGLVGDLPADAPRARGLPGRPSSPEKATFRRRDDGIETQLDDRGLARGRRRGAAARGHEPQRPPARDRDHELRRDRARARRPTTSPTRPSASCSSRPSTCPSARRSSAGGGRARPTSRRCGRCTS